MKRTILAALLVGITLALTGCGDYDDGYYYYYPPYPPPPQTFFTEIFSNPALDGDISKNSVTGDLTVRQGMSPDVQSVFAGTNPATGDESRAFLDFPLTGGVPGNAFIYSAVLNIFIDNIQTLTGTIPVRIDLVSYRQPLIGADFDSTSLATVSTTLFQSDFGQHVDIDVTPLMVQAQTLGLTDFQIRILVETPAGFVEIDDTTGTDWQLFAPLLKVTFS